MGDGVGEGEGEGGNGCSQGCSLGGVPGSPQRHRIDLPLLRSPRPAESHKEMSVRETVAGAPTAVECLLTGQLAIPQVSPLATNESHVQEMKWG